jgi:hypothetical protein
MFEVNLLAVLVAAAANFVIGFLMHGPIAGKLWMKLAHIKPTGKETFSDMVPQMVKNFLVNVVFAYGLAIVYTFASTSSLLGSPGVLTGLLCASIVWLGFVVSSSSIEVIWMGKSYKLWLFESFSSLLCVLSMGAIIGSW